MLQDFHHYTPTRTLYAHGVVAMSSARTAHVMPLLCCLYSSRLAHGRAVRFLYHSMDVNQH